MSDPRIKQHKLEKFYNECQHGQLKQHCRICKLEANNQRLSAEVERLREVLKDCLSSMIVLSDETFEMFKDRKDTDTIYSWEAGRYRAMKRAADKTRTALKGGDDG